LIHWVDVHDLNKNEEEGGNSCGYLIKLFGNILNVIFDVVCFKDLLINLDTLSLGLIKRLKEHIIFKNIVTGVGNLI
jgi:hypothetical protein